MSTAGRQLAHYLLRTPLSLKRMPWASSRSKTLRRPSSLWLLEVPAEYR